MLLFFAVRLRFRLYSRQLVLVPGRTNPTSCKLAARPQTRATGPMRWQHSCPRDGLKS